MTKLATKIIKILIILLIVNFCVPHNVSYAQENVPKKCNWWKSPDVKNFELCLPQGFSIKTKSQLQADPVSSNKFTNLKQNSITIAGPLEEGGNINAELVIDLTNFYYTILSDGGLHCTNGTSGYIDNSKLKLIAGNPSNINYYNYNPEQIILNPYIANSINIGSKSIYRKLMDTTYYHKEVRGTIYVYEANRYFRINNIEDFNKHKSNVKSKRPASVYKDKNNYYFINSDPEKYNETLKSEIEDKDSILCQDYNLEIGHLSSGYSSLTTNDLAFNNFSATKEGYTSEYKNIHPELTVFGQTKGGGDYNTSRFDDIVKSICSSEYSCNKIKQTFNTNIVQGDDNCSENIVMSTDSIEDCYTDQTDQEANLDLQINVDDLKNQYIESKSDPEKSILSSIPNSVYECAANSSPDITKKLSDHIADTIDFGLEAIPIIGSLYQGFKGWTGYGITNQSSCIEKSLNTIFGATGIIAESAGLITGGIGTLTAKTTGITVKLSLKELFLQSGVNIIKQLAKGNIKLILSKAVQQAIQTKIVSETFHSGIKLLTKQSDNNQDLEIYSHYDNWDYDNIDQVSNSNFFTINTQAFAPPKSAKLTLGRASNGIVNITAKGKVFKGIGKLAEDSIEGSLGRVFGFKEEYVKQTKFLEGNRQFNNHKGTTIPDFYSENAKTALEVKAYNLDKNFDNAGIVRGYKKGLYGMLETAKKQFLARNKELPEGTIQKLIIDNRYFINNQHDKDFIIKQASQYLSTDPKNILVIQRSDNADELLKNFLKQ